MLKAKCSSCQTIPIIRSKRLLVTGFKLCDFFVWTEKETFLETILVDTEIQADILSKTKPLFCDILLPEVVGKYFTNSTNSDKTKDSSMVPH